MSHQVKPAWIAGVFAVAMASACVWEPNHQETVSRTAPFDVRGWGQISGSTIEVKALNHATGAYDTIMTTTASTSPNWANPSLFHYSTVPFVLPNTYWVPPGAPCNTTGMASLQIYENGSKLVAFDQAQRDCVSNAVWNGAHPVNAGQDCGTSSQLVLFSPGSC